MIPIISNWYCWSSQRTALGEQTALLHRIGRLRRTVKEKCPVCDHRTLHRYLGPKRWVSMEVGHYEASCTKCRRRFWKHESPDFRDSQIPWLPVGQGCDCAEETKLI